jgi:hypothetical protein
METDGRTGMTEQIVAFRNLGKHLKRVALYRGLIYLGRHLYIACMFRLVTGHFHVSSRVLRHTIIS